MLYVYVICNQIYAIAKGNILYYICNVKCLMCNFQYAEYFRLHLVTFYMIYAIASIHYDICNMPYGIRYMQYAVCDLLYAI